MTWTCPDCQFTCLRAGSHRGSGKCLERQRNGLGRVQGPPQAQTRSRLSPAVGTTPSFITARKKIMRRIPKAARASVAIALTKLMQGVVSTNDTPWWHKLLSAPSAILSLPGDTKKPRKTSITSHIRDRIAKFESGELDGEEPSAPGKPRHATPEDEISRRVGIQIDDFNVSGAVRTLLSSDSVADITPEVIESMQRKHPAAPLPTLPADLPATPFVPLSPTEVLSVLEAMPRGSAGGLDYLRPQHLLDLIGARLDDASSALCDSLTDLLNLILTSNIPTEIVPLLCGARLVALRKKDGGLRPIAVGNVYRRLAAKAVDIRIRPVTSELLQPHQLGSGVKRGVEAVIHTARDFLLQYSKDVKALLKIDFTNAFNCVSREEVLKIASEVIPEYYAFIKLCFGTYSMLFLGETVISSQSGVQQGDPLGPALFCLVLQLIIDKINTDLNAWYMDDGTLGGHPSSVLRNFQLLITEALRIGLSVNIAKCELFLCGGTEVQRLSVIENFTTLFPGIRVLTVDKLCLLGSPLLPPAVVPIVNEKISQLGVMCSRLQLIPKHQALFLLKNCLGVPKIVHILRTSLAWMFPQELYRLDQVFRDAVEMITNVRMDHPTWLQASLPVRFGGLGVRRTEKLAPSAYLASASSLFPLTSRLCPTLTATDLSAATRAWKLLADTDELPSEVLRHVQKAWDTPTTLNTYARLTELRATKEEIAHLKAVSVPESGVWIHALPAACLGNLLENNTFRISIALRLGAPIVTPHVCVCGGLVDDLGRHGLRCKRSAGRLPRHDGLSGEFTRGLKTAGFPARMEPKGLSVKDRKRPDVITLVPWERGKPLAIDVTCVDTLAASYIDRTLVNVGAAAEHAERGKLTKHGWLQPRYNFMAAAFEIYGPWGNGTKTLVQKIGNGIATATGQKRAKEFFRQRLSIQMQRGNAICVMGTIPEQDSIEEVFLL